MHSHHTEHHNAEHRHSRGPAAEADWDDMADVLELGAGVLHEYLSDLAGWVRELAGDLPGGRILDLGCGTGAGAFELARQFATASLIAVDASDGLLSRVQVKAGQLGLAGRIATLRADLDDAWPAIDPVDLAWASLSLHHLADPDRVLTQIFTAIRPGGFLAVAEMASFPRFLPDDLGHAGPGRPGLEERCHAALAEQVADSLPHLGSDWGPRLRQAGFTPVAERSFEIDLSPPLPAGTGRYAKASLQRVRSAVADRLSADDLAALDALLTSDGPDGILQRDDLNVRAPRTAWVARRP